MSPKESKKFPLRIFEVAGISGSTPSNGRKQKNPDLFVSCNLRTVTVQVGKNITIEIMTVNVLLLKIESNNEMSKENRMKYQYSFRLARPEKVK